MKRPDYGDATPEDLARAFMNVHQRKAHYRRSVRDKSGSSPSVSLQRPSSDSKCHAPSGCVSPQTPERSDQDA